MLAISYIALCLIWGSTWMFIKLGLDFFPPMTFAAVRFMLTAAFLFIILIITYKKDSFKNFFSWPAIIFGVFNGFSYALVFEGENSISSSLTAILNAVLPFSALIIAAIIIGEKITYRKIIGMSIGFLGISALYWNDLGNATPSMIAGSIMILLSTVTYSTGAVIAKKHQSKGNILQTVTLQMLISGIVLTILALIIEPNPIIIWAPKGIIALIYLSAIGSALAFLLYYYLLKNIEVSSLSYVSMITPIIAVMLGVVFLNESFHLSQLWTLLAVMSGMYIINYR